MDNNSRLPCPPPARLTPHTPSAHTSHKDVVSHEQEQQENRLILWLRMTEERQGPQPRQNNNLHQTLRYQQWVITSTLQHSSRPSRQQQTTSDGRRAAKSRDQFIRQPRPGNTGGIISAWSPQAGLINTIRQAPANTIHASPAHVITCNYFETYVKIKHELGERKK